MKRIVFLSAFASVALAQAPTAGSATRVGTVVKMGAVILGRVQSESAAPVGSAWVTILREPNAHQFPSPDPKEKVAPFSSGQAVRPDGTFGFSGLEPGTYRLCASFAGTTWLNSCEWPSGPVISLKMGAEQIVDRIVLTMRKGAPLKIRLNDPGSFLALHEKKTPGAHVLLGIRTDSGRFQPADIVANDAQGRDYSVLIPTGSTVNVVFYSAFFKLQDHQGNAVASAGSKIPIASPGGQSPAALVLAVTGVVKP